MCGIGDVHSARKMHIGGAGPFVLRVRIKCGMSRELLFGKRRIKEVFNRKALDLAIRIPRRAPLTFSMQAVMVVP